MTDKMPTQDQVPPAAGVTPGAAEPTSSAQPAVTPETGAATTHTPMVIDTPAKAASEAEGSTGEVRQRTNTNAPGTPNPSETKRSRRGSPTKASKGDEAGNLAQSKSSTPAQGQEESGSAGGPATGSALKPPPGQDDSQEGSKPAAQNQEESPPSPPDSAKKKLRFDEPNRPTLHSFKYDEKPTTVWSNRFITAGKHKKLLGFDPHETTTSRTLGARCDEAMKVMLPMVQQTKPDRTRESVTMLDLKAVLHDTLRQENDLHWTNPEDKAFLLNHSVKLAKTHPSIFAPFLRKVDSNKSLLPLNSNTKQWLAAHLLYGNIWKYFNNQGEPVGEVSLPAQLKDPDAGRAAVLPEHETPGSNAPSPDSGDGGWIKVKGKPKTVPAGNTGRGTRVTTVWQIRKPIIGPVPTMGRDTVDKKISAMAKHHITAFHKCDPTVKLLPMRPDPAGTLNLAPLTKLSISTMPPTLTGKNAKNYYQFFEWTMANSYQDRPYFQTRIRTETTQQPQDMLQRLAQVNEEIPEEYRLLALRICPVQSVALQPICWLKGSATDSMNLEETEKAIKESLKARNQEKSFYLENRPVQTTTIKRQFGDPPPRPCHATHVMGDPQEREEILTAFTELYTKGQVFKDYPMCKFFQVIPCIQSQEVDPQQVGYATHAEAMTRQRTFQAGLATMEVPHFKELQGIRLGGDGPNLLEAIMAMSRRGSQGKIQFFTAADTKVSDSSKLILTFPAVHEPEAKSIMNAGPLTMINHFGKEAEQWCTELALANMQREYTVTEGGAVISNMATRFADIQQDFEDIQLTPAEERRAESIREQMAADQEAAGIEEPSSGGCQILNMEFMLAGKPASDPTSGVRGVPDNPSIAAQENTVYSASSSQHLESGTVGSKTSLGLEGGTVASEVSCDLDDASVKEPTAMAVDVDLTHNSGSSSESEVEEEEEGETEQEGEAVKPSWCTIDDCCWPEEASDDHCTWCTKPLHLSCSVQYLLIHPLNITDHYCCADHRDEHLALEDDERRAELNQKPFSTSRNTALQALEVPLRPLAFPKATVDGDATWWELYPEGRDKLYTEYLTTVAKPFDQTPPYNRRHGKRIFLLALQVHVRQELQPPATFIEKVSGTSLHALFEMHEFYHDAPPPDDATNQGGQGEEE